MSYGLKYQSTFDPIGLVSATPVYLIQILEKDYGGSVTDVICSGIPIIHKWYEDDPKAPIKGSSLTINFINKNNSLPLSSFFSTDDDQFQVKFWWGTDLLFIGFLVQDDCSETMVDFTHEINLSANDNLGLLKDVALDKAKIIYDVVASVTDTWSTTAPHTVTLPVSISVYVKPGDLIVIHNIIFDVTYHVTEANGGVDVIVSEVVTTGTTGTSDDLEIQHPRPFADKVTLAFIIENCLWATGQRLNTYVWGRIIEVSQDELSSFIHQTLIDPLTYLEDDTKYKDCYQVLTELFTAFKMSSFQAKGVWNIVRWDELRYYSNAMLAYVYDPDFALVTTASMDSETTAGIGEVTVAETGLLQKILRPFLFTKETFNYKQPARLLRNFDLQDTGQLLNTSTTGSGTTLETTYEYEALWWAPSVRPDAGSGTYFIRVVNDYLGNEISRLLVLTHDVFSYRIEANKGDVFKFSFSFKTQDSQAGNINLVMFVQLYDGTTTNFFNEPVGPTTGWQTSPGWVYNIPSGDNSNEWHSVEIDSTFFPVPFDGLLYFYLRIADLSGTINETYYRDIRLEYLYYINESTKIIGHTHKSEQVAVIKQTEDIQIYCDTSPRSSIAGTLFLDTMTGLLYDKTKRWQHPYLSANMLLGNLITFEQLFWRRIPRTILEGTFRGLASSGNHISMLTVFLYTYFPDLNFVAGTMEIDYRNNKFTGTLWEIWKGSEVDADLSSTYEFKYLYSTK